jgi:hypothetical protein
MGHIGMTENCPCHTKFIRNTFVWPKYQKSGEQNTTKEAIKNLTLDTHYSSFVAAAIFFE